VSEKIFIDLDDEIIFITEKVAKAQGNDVILIVPDRASLLGSIVNLKLLFSNIAKSKKNVILVTKDDIGQKLARRASFVSVENVGEITDQIWNKARDSREKFIEELEKNKKKFLNERTEQPKESVKSSGNAIGKMEPKKVNIDGFEMMSGGDIAEADKEADKIDEEESATDVSSKISQEEGYPEEGDKLSAKREYEKVSGLLGKDLSTFSYVSEASEKNKGEKVKSKKDTGRKGNEIISKVKAFFTSGGVKNKIIIGFVVLLIVVFAVSYFILPKGEVVIKVESQDIEVEREVIADTEVMALDIDSLTIPATVVESVKDSSDSAQATGKKETGEKASGQVTLYNLSESEVKINSGTVLESVETGLTYTITTDVVVPAKKLDDDPESPGLIGTASVGLVAQTFGEDYNVSKKVEYRVEGFEVDSLYGKNFNNITGGTTEENTVVSQEDYDNLKISIDEKLKIELQSGLSEEAGTNREFLEDTISYEIINEDASPGVDAETDTFNLSLTMKATALSFLKEDIDTLAEALVAESDQDVEVEEFEYSSSVSKTEGNKIYIDLVITGVVTPSINEDDIKSNLTSKSRSKAEEYLDEYTEIEDYKIDLSPKWLPGFLAHFPSSVDKIKIEIEKV